MFNKREIFNSLKITPLVKMSIADYVSSGDKEYDARISGMIQAYNLAIEHGIDALEKDIKMRGIYKVPSTMTEEQFNKFLNVLAEGSKNAVFAIVYVVLCEDFGFGEKRLNKFAEGFVKRFQDVFALDYMGGTLCYAYRLCSHDERKVWIIAS